MSRERESDEAELARERERESRSREGKRKKESRSRDDVEGERESMADPQGFLVIRYREASSLLFGCLSLNELIFFYRDERDDIEIADPMVETENRDLEAGYETEYESGKQSKMDED